MRGNWKAAIGFCGVLGLAHPGAAADTLVGRVMGAGSSPLAGVRVALPKLNLVDTTGADGRFELKLPASGLFSENENGMPSGFATDAVETETAALRDLSGRSVSHPSARDIVLFADPEMRRTGRRQSFSETMVLAKAAADGDTLVLSKTGWFVLKKPMPATGAGDMGDLAMIRNIAGVGVANYDKYDQHIVAAYPRYGLDSSMAMVIKAMIVIESSFNAKAISMWDTQLPCGTHSYGLIQVTPGCERGYATLPGTTAVTAAISGGLNGNPAVLTYPDPADKASGNTIVKENGIVIDLVTDESSPLWAMSAFNPAYSIDNGAKAIAGVLGEMKSRFGNCSTANYVSMALAGYNQGSSTVSGCTSYSANGTAYQDKVLKQYRTFCKAAGVAPVY